MVVYGASPCVGVWLVASLSMLLIAWLLARTPGRSLVLVSSSTLARAGHACRCDDQHGTGA
jgi:hypothetical protein